MPISDCEVRDPRIRRTRQLLQGALRDLLQTRSFDEISVQDIAEAATVNRATFYDHYNDKYALLEALAAGGFHALLQERQVQFDVGCPSAACAVIEATCDYLQQLHQSGSCNKQNAFEPLMDAAIVHAIRRVLTCGQSDSPASQMAITAASWAIYGAAKEWRKSADKQPSSEVVPQILNLVLPILRQAGATPVTASDFSGLLASSHS